MIKEIIFPSGLLRESTGIHILLNYLNDLMLFCTRVISGFGINVTGTITLAYNCD